MRNKNDYDYEEQIKKLLRRSKRLEKENKQLKSTVKILQELMKLDKYENEIIMKDCPNCKNTKLTKRIINEHYYTITCQSCGYQNRDHD